MPAAVRRSQAVSPRRSASSQGGGTRLREVFGIVLLALGLFTGTALVSLQFGDGSLMGPLGRFCARTFYAIAGIGSYLMVAGLIVGPIRMLSGRRAISGLAEAAGGVLGVISLAVLLHLVGGNYRVAGYAAGGRLGEFIAEVMRAGVSTAGTALFGVVGVFLALIATTPLEIKSVGAIVRALAARTFAVLRFALGEIARFIGEVVRAILPEHEDDDGAYEDDDEDDAPAEKPTRARKTRKPTDPTLDPAAADLDGAPFGELTGDTVRVGEPLMEPVIVEPRTKKNKKKEALLVADADAAGAPHPETLPGLGNSAPPPATAAGEIAAPVAVATAAAEAAPRPCRTPTTRHVRRAWKFLSTAST